MTKPQGLTVATSPAVTGEGQRGVNHDSSSSRRTLSSSAWADSSRLCTPATTLSGDEGGGRHRHAAHGLEERAVVAPIPPATASPDGRCSLTADQSDVSSADGMDVTAKRVPPPTHPASMEATSKGDDRGGRPTSAA